SRRSSRRTRLSSPSVPGCAKRGACRVGVAKFMLPRPPLPPLASTQRRPFSRRSARTSEVSASRTSVPGGTFSTMSGAAWPFWSRPRPGSPFFARYSRLKRKSSSVVRRSSVSRTMVPPLPPSPPEGPPRGTNFSLRKATAPGPPSPAFAEISASSMNCTGRSPCFSGLGLGLRCVDVHVDAVAAALLVLHHALDHGIEREVAAHLDAAAGVHPGAHLPDQDVARNDGLAAEDLDAP